MRYTTNEESAGKGGGQRSAFGLQARQEVQQGGSIEPPIEGARLSIAQFPRTASVAAPRLPGWAWRESDMLLHRPVADANGCGRRIGD
jgi:hypothetical protein